MLGKTYEKTWTRCSESACVGCGIAGGARGISGDSSGRFKSRVSDRRAMLRYITCVALFGPRRRVSLLRTPVAECWAGSGAGARLVNKRAGGGPGDERAEKLATQLSDPLTYVTSTSQLPSARTLHFSQFAALTNFNYERLRTTFEEIKTPNRQRPSMV